MSTELTREEVERECQWLIEEHCQSAARKWDTHDASQRERLRLAMWEGQQITAAIEDDEIPADDPLSLNVEGVRKLRATSQQQADKIAELESTMTCMYEGHRQQIEDADTKIFLAQQQIQQLELEVTSYKKVIASNQKEFRKAEEIIQQLEAQVKELTVVAGRVLKLEEHIREVCGIELNVLSNMGISFVEKAVRWYQQRVKELEGRLAESEKAAYDIDETIQHQKQTIEQLEVKMRAYEDRLFRSRAMDTPPCFCCGYNGPGYYQPGTHSCAARYHAALDSATDSA